MTTNDTSAAVPLSDVEESLARKQETRLQAQAAIASIGSVLDGLSDGVDRFEDQDGVSSSLGPTVCRFASDLADSVASLRNHRLTSDDDRLALARALQRDAASASGADSDNNNNTLSHLSEEDLMGALSGVDSLLVDVEASLRSIGKDEAEELAEVGLTVAKIFLFTLRSFYQSVAPQILSSIDDAGTTPPNTNSSVRIEELPGEKESSNATDKKDAGDKTDKDTDPQTPTSQFQLPWPPIGPAVWEAGKTGKQAAHEHPILAVALAMTLWPVATATVFLGIPLLTVDWALQNTCDKLPSIQHHVGQTASNIYEVGHLYYLCAKLLVKQGTKVGQRQIERRGGVGQVAADIGGAVVDRAMHPVETIGMAVNGVKTGLDMAKHVGGFVKDMATSTMERRNTMVTEVSS